jgi:hypothetical protein
VRPYLIALLAFSALPAFSDAQAVTPSSEPVSSQVQSPTPQAQTPPQPGQLPPQDNSNRQTSSEELKRLEHQRILGIIPEFNTADLQNATRLTPKQKFRLAFRSATDPATIAIAGVVAGLSQWQNSYEGYGQGAAGYFKRFGASYADTFDGTMFGNAIFPTLFHQDPRYFRKGTGTANSRFWYAVLTTVRCRNDDGNWAPNFSNVLGNLAAGGISNAYYPSSDRGAGLTIERALVVSAEGAIGAIFYEFYPDLQRKFLHKKH